MSIDELELTIRSNNGLKNAGITTVEQLMNLSLDQIRAFEHLGDKSINEIVWSVVCLGTKSINNYIEDVNTYQHYINKSRDKYERIAAIVREK